MKCVARPTGPRRRVTPQYDEFAPIPPVTRRPPGNFCSGCRQIPRHAKVHCERIDRFKPVPNPSRRDDMRGRRIRRIALGLVVVLLVWTGAREAWRRRPLSAEGRKIVGEWVFRDVLLLRYRSNRTLESWSLTDAGTWYLNGTGSWELGDGMRDERGDLWTPSSLPLDRRLARLWGRFNVRDQLRHVATVRFEGDDVLWRDEARFVRYQNRPDTAEQSESP
jgi:hypothetical protein